MPAADGRGVQVEGSGCCGRRHGGAVAHGTLLARAAGRPVRGQWMRADGDGLDAKEPPTPVDLHGGLDGDGQPDGVKDQIVGNIVQTKTAL